MSKGQIKMDLREFLKILQLENSFTADTLKKAYDNYCSRHRPVLFLNNKYSDFHSNESLEKMNSAFAMLMSFLSQNGHNKRGGAKTVEEVSQDSFGVITVNSIGLTMVYIKPASFIMGTIKNGSRVIYPGEEQHIVQLTKGFYIGVMPITQFQWHSVMGTHPKDLSGKEYFSAPGHPVYYVNWHDCQEFLANLNKTLGSTKFRLPTEAEWEYACRAGSFSEFYFGDNENDLGIYAWHSGIRKYHRPQEVGLLTPNQWGLYDMLGNVSEWCQDWISQPGHIPANSVDPKGPSLGQFKVLRGGNWHHKQSAYLRYAAREFDDPRKRNYFYGFRIAMDI
jgi:formylglycine-generating enzyme required for sulfatase activity